MVWAAILNPDVLKECVPGCTEMSGNPDDGFEATVVQKVGPVKATFKGAVTVSERDEPNSLKLSGEGKGGAAGFAKGGATVTLEESGEGTKLSYDVEANVGGKLAQRARASSMASPRRWRISSSPGCRKPSKVPPIPMRPPRPRKRPARRKKAGSSAPFPEPSHEG